MLSEYTSFGVDDEGEEMEEDKEDEEEENGKRCGRNKES